MDPERLESAREVIRALWDREPAGTPFPDEPEEEQELSEILMGHLFADSWGRAGLDARTKALLAIAFAVALDVRAGVRDQIDGALDLGITAGEIVEVLIHALAYVGVLRTGNALAEARLAFAGRAASSA